MCFELSFFSGEDISDVLQSSLEKYDSVQLPAGEFYISKTIFLRDGNSISGVPGFGTKLILSNASNTNMFSNIDHHNGNYDLKFCDLHLDGNGSNQFRPETQKKLSFCNIVYMSRVNGVSFQRLKGMNCHQTVLHFNNCSDVVIDDLYAAHLGWSGISTSGTSRLTAKNIYVFDSGNDHRHSAIHLDGGVSNYLQATVIKCVGNGVMLDSQFSDFGFSVVEANCYDCMRGIAVIGSSEKMPHNILIKNSRLINNDVGVMISNARNCFIVDTNIEDNMEYGLLFQGRVGGCDNLINGVTYKGNKVDFSEIHESKNNYFV